MAVKIGHALRDENGKLKNGKAGDQTSKEVLIQNWYLHKLGWVVLRADDPEIAEGIAEGMEKACKNNKIGYDQNNRYSLYNLVKKKGFDPSKATKNCETVCSDLVRICTAYAFGKDIIGKVLTAKMPAVYVKTGYFKKLTSSKYCKSSDYLKRGDIICTPVSGHCAVILEDGPKVEPPTFEMDVYILTEGCTGNAVKALQALITAAGIECGKIDGDFGVKTLKGLKEYQKLKGLTPDGSCGPKTWAKLIL